VRYFEWRTSESHRDIVGKSSDQTVREIVYRDVAELLDAKPVRHVHYDYGRSWLGVDDYTTLPDKILRGWPEVLSALREMLDEIKLPDGVASVNEHRRRKRVRSDIGNEVDIHYVNQGRSDRAWTRTKHVEVTGPQTRRIHMFVNLSASGMVSAHNQLWRAAAACRLYEALINNGKSVAVTVGFASNRMMEGFGGTTFVSVPVKSYGGDVTQDRLAAMFTAGFWRHHLCWTGANVVPDWKPWHHYGWPIDSYSVLPKELMEDRERGAQVIVVGQCFDQYAAQKVVGKFAEQYSNIVSRPDGLGAVTLLGG
jgi:hypothetical protein